MLQSDVTRGKPATEGATWRLLGFDPFAGEYYDIGTASSREAAEAAARAELERLEEEQPTALSGGQREGGLQDRVFIATPEGRRERYLPPEPAGQA